MQLRCRGAERCDDCRRLGHQQLPRLPHPQRQIVARCETPNGILHVEPGDFAAVLRRAVEPWLAGRRDARSLMAGMVGSRQGWREVPYVPCPAGPGELARGVAPSSSPAPRVQIVPGVEAQRRQRRAGGDARRGNPDRRRARRTRTSATACLPGSHSKWVNVADGRIAGFTTHMTGEAFAALRTPHDPRPHDAGRPHRCRRVPPRRRPFGRSTAGCCTICSASAPSACSSALPETEAASYLSGLLIGHEVAAAAPARHRCT